MQENFGKKRFGIAFVVCENRSARSREEGREGRETRNGSERKKPRAREKVGYIEVCQRWQQPLYHQASGGLFWDCLLTKWDRTYHCIIFVIIFSKPESVRKYPGLQGTDCVRSFPFSSSFTPAATCLANYMFLLFWCGFLLLLLLLR